MILGLAVLIFGIVQAWAALATTGKLAWYHGPLFAVLMGLVGTGIVYQLLRFYMFGKMASALLNVSVGAFNRGKDDWDEEHKEQPDEKWNHLPDLRKVSVYASSVYEQYSKPWLDLGMFARANNLVRPNALFLILIFEAWSTSSYWLIFIAPSPYYLLEFVCISGVITLLGYLVWQMIISPWVVRVYSK